MFDEEDDGWFGDTPTAPMSDQPAPNTRKLAITRRTRSLDAGAAGARSSLSNATYFDDTSTGFILDTIAPRQRINRAAAFRRPESADTSDR